MKSILVTGAAGFIGSNLCEFYLKNNFRIIGLDNFSTGSADNIIDLQNKYPKSFKFTKTDVCDHWPSFTEEIEYVFHLASPASVQQYSKLSLETMWANSIGLNNAIKFADSKNAQVIFASTSEIYGTPLISPQPESYWGNTNSFGDRSCYNESKRFGESLIFSSNKKNKTTHKVVRIFNSYGPRMNLNDDRVVITFLKQALKNENITLFGNGLQTRSFCYIDDLVIGLDLLARSSITTPINLGNNSEITILKLAENIIKITASKSNISLMELPIDDPPQRCPDLAKALTELKWSPKTNLEDGLILFSHWLKNKIEHNKTNI